jgi:hypothetical protein
MKWTSLLKTKKNQKNIFVFVKLILFVGVIFVLFEQIRRFDHEALNSFVLIRPLSFFLAVILVFPNIWLAFLKWKITLTSIGIYSDSALRVQSFFAGIVTGMLTPNMIGNFIGRFYYFERKHRSQIVVFTMLSNFSQFLASVTFGTIAIMILDKVLVLDSSQEVVTLLFVVLLLSYLTYFFLDNFLARFKARQTTRVFHEILKQNRSYRLKLLGLSFGRFFLFTTQFSLMLNAFGAEWNLTLIASIWQVYLITMLAPSLFLGKIGIKESISLFVLGALGLNDVSILFSSLVIWFVNSMLPALVGLAICRNQLKE